MRKAFKLQDLDCANCAAKMENGIKSIDGVSSATVSFMTQKLVLEADDDRFDAVLDEARTRLPQDRARLRHPALSDQPSPHLHGRQKGSRARFDSLNENLRTNH